MPVDYAATLPLRGTPHYALLCLLLLIAGYVAGDDAAAITR